MLSSPSCSCCRSGSSSYLLSPPQPTAVSNSWSSCKGEDMLFKQSSASVASRRATHAGTSICLSHSGWKLHLGKVCTTSCCCLRFCTCSESRSLSTQLSALQEQCQHSQASQREAESQLAAARGKLKAAEDVAASQASANTQLQHRLSAAEAALIRATTQLQQLQASHQALLDKTSQERQIQEGQQAAHNHTNAEVRTCV